MNQKQLKAIAITVALLIGTTVTPTAIATATGVQNLGDTSSNIDIFTFTCPADTGAQARVNDLAYPKPIGVHVLAVLGHDGTPTSQVLDDTDNGIPSTWTPIIPESGLYAVAFKKTGVAPESYIGNVRCCTATKTCTNPILTRRIDQ